MDFEKFKNYLEICEKYGECTILSVDKLSCLSCRLSEENPLQIFITIYKKILSNKSFYYDIIFKKNGEIKDVCVYEIEYNKLKCRSILLEQELWTDLSEFFSSDF